MLPKPRARAKKRLGWPFGRRRNRRVRAPQPRAGNGERIDATPTGQTGDSADQTGDVTGETREPTGEQPRRSREPRPSIFAALKGLVARRRRAFVSAAIGVLLAAGAWGGRWYLTHARHFVVRKVRVSPLRHVSAEALIARAGVPLGRNLFAVDRDEIAHSVSQEPWIAKVKVRLELPSTIVIDAVEREAVCDVALGALYLADASGNVFKRATPEEAAGLPVVTGIARDAYVADPEHTRAEIRDALAAIAAWSALPERPRLGEAHVDRLSGLTLYTDKGMGVRLGAVDDSMTRRLQRCDAVLAALEQSGEHPRLIYIDNRARPDRVTVKLASAEIASKLAPAQIAAQSAKSGTN